MRGGSGPGGADVSPPVAVLIVAGGQEVVAEVRGALARRAAYVETASDPDRATSLCQRCHFDMVVLAGGGEALSWWRAARQDGLVARAVLVTDRIDRGLLLEALRLGVEDVFEKPLDGRALAGRILELPRRAPAGYGPAMPEEDPELVGECSAMREVKALIDRTAPLPTPVLIEGEPATGKTTAARTIHALSGRTGPFVAVDCGGVAPELLESELFGEARSRLSTGRPERDGLFVAARAGTLFFEEVGDLPAAIQVKLLRALDNRRVRPAGADEEIAVDVRVIASTRHDLRARALEGEFRDDLFYGLSVVHLGLPPLRRRGADIVRLAEHFGAEAAARTGTASPDLDIAARKRLLAHAWPGNIRELKAVMERAAAMGRVADDEPGRSARAAAEDRRGYPPDWTLEAVKIDHMRRVVEACAGNKSQAARQLAVSRKTLDRKLS